MRLVVLQFALLAKHAFLTAVPVDFFVFRGKDGDEQNVAPRTSMNINPPDGETGFHALCKDRCPVFLTKCGAGCTSPQMRWCKCVAELLVQDLSFDFSALAGAQSPVEFTLGDYVEISESQDFFSVPDGHRHLYSLMEADGSRPYARRSGRVSVWVANHVSAAGKPHSMLGGTTLLDQPLWQGGKGAGVLFCSQTDRSSKVLSHEVGHIVGFHHTAGPSMMYVYEHPECPKEYRHVETHPLVFPTCEVNIMGYWYDGPYCCPGESPSFLFQLRAGRSRRKKCLAHSVSDYQEAHCCDPANECTYTCPPTMPLPKFDTKDHKEALGKILQCWLHLRTVPEPKTASPVLLGIANGTESVAHKSPVECFDYDRKLGSSILGSCI